VLDGLDRRQLAMQKQLKTWREKKITRKVVDARNSQEKTERDLEDRKRPFAEESIHQGEQFPDLGSKKKIPERRLPFYPKRNGESVWGNRRRTTSPGRRGRPLCKETGTHFHEGKGVGEKQFGAGEGAFLDTGPGKAALLTEGCLPPGNRKEEVSGAMAVSPTCRGNPRNFITARKGHARRGTLGGGGSRGP